MNHHLTANSNVDGMCSRGNDAYELPYAFDDVGDISETDTGLKITTPHGHWEITIEDALGLITGLSSMLRSPTRSRELRRPASQTAELAHIADYHA